MWLFIRQIELKAKLSPCFINNVKSGVQDILNRRLLRYTPAFEGIMLAYFDTKLRSNAGIIRNELPMFYVNVSTKALVFRAKSGTRMIGLVNKVSSSHIGMLVHDMFNASVVVGQLPEGSTYDDVTETWTLQPNSQKIKVGSAVSFLVRKFEFEEEVGLISIFGSNVSLNVHQDVAVKDSAIVEKKRKRGVDSDAREKREARADASIEVGGDDVKLKKKKKKTKKQKKK